MKLASDLILVFQVAVYVNAYCCHSCFRTLIAEPEQHQQAPSCVNSIARME